MAIAPETKDWTWVLQRRCDECGVDATALDVRRVGDTVRAMAVTWCQVLARPDVGVRPDAATWSPLEYACHVRDVFRLFDQRLRLMLTEDAPGFASWDQDATAVDDAYGEQDPAVVADELAAAATTVAARFDTVVGEQWQRTGTRSDGARFTVDSFARYFVHDPLHHLHDVGAPLPPV